MSDDNKMGLRLLTDIILAAVFGPAVYKCFVQINSLNGLYYHIGAYPFDSRDMIWYAVLAGIFLVGWRLLLGRAVKLNESPDSDPGREMRVAVLPFVLFSPFIFLPLTYFTVIFFMLLVVICTFRAVAAWPVRVDVKFEKRTVVLLLILLTLGAWRYGYMIQQGALDCMYLPYWDWAIFLNVIDNTAHGKWFYSNHEQFNFMARHFQPVLALYIPFLAVSRSVYTFFLVNTAILVSGGPLLFMLARKLGLKPVSALTLAFCYLISPSVINLNLTAINGVHTIYMFLPILIVFFFFFESENWLGAYLTFAFSLMIKETTGAFWFGAGIAIALSYPKRRKHGAILAVAGLCWILLFLKVIQPALAPADVSTSSLYRFAQLGKTEMEILLSPIMAPEAFWGTLFRPCSVYFILLLVLPFICLLPGRFWLAVGAFPVLLFTIMQSSNQLQNLHMQYQTMPLALLWCTAVLCLRDINEGRVSKWFNILLYKLNIPKSGSRLFPAGVSSLLCGFVLIHFFVAIDPFGKEVIGRFADETDYSPYVDDLKKVIPPGAELAAPPRLAAHLVLHNDVYTRYDKDREYMLLDLGDSFAKGSAIEAVRKRLLADKKYSLIFNQLIGNKRWMLFKRVESRPERKNNLVRMSLEQWEYGGMPVEGSSDALSIRFSLVQGAEEGRVLRFLFRLNYEVDNDFLFKIQVQSDAGFISRILHFGDGVQPAYSAQPGDIYVYDLTLPPDLGTPKGVGCKVIPLPVPR